LSVSDPVGFKGKKLTEGKLCTGFKGSGLTSDSRAESVEGTEEGEEEGLALVEQLGTFLLHFFQLSWLLG
jgi:hypothetical protein